MFIDLTHNKVISETISASFKNSVEARLIPMLEARYGTSLIGIQMYEDYIADSFLFNGEWYYPLTLVFADSQRTLWIKWPLTRGAFAGGNPYAYVGSETVEFAEADSVPDEFKNALDGRSIYCESGIIPVRIDFAGADPTFLSGKYSQSFIDEMARQLTREICRLQAVESLSGSSIELRLVFSPETYMEHTSENITYRRLLLTDKGCAPRDFWVKWTRLDGAVAYSVSDTPAADAISFEIGEDVPQKVREREYRYLVRVDADKYHGAMSRKNVTDWRDILKRAIRRGDIIKIEEDASLSGDGDEELRRELSAILGVSVEQKQAHEPELAEEESDLIRLAREALKIDVEDIEEPVTVAAPLDEITASLEDETAEESEDSEENIYLGADDEDEDTLADVAALEGADSISVLDVEENPEENVVEETKEVPAAAPTVSSETLEEAEERIRREIETKLRLEYESRARAAAEEEAARLRREQELLKAENERLMEKARRDAEMKAQEEARLKAEIEAKLRSEEKEKERLAEAAMLAMQEKRRLEAERAEKERLAREEEKRIAEEKARAAEQARIEAERAKEAERIRREAERAAEVAKVLEEQGAPKYISRTAEFTFRRIVDPNITKRIYEIVKATIEFYHKEDVYIRIKASVPDSSTVKLEFLEVPEEEGELIVNIIKALGRSDLGIAKATLD